jgi:Histidine kinase-, DNA gyrase B-, and HSP90-like ATPase
VGGETGRFFIKRLAGSDLGWFGAARRNGVARGNQRGITIDRALLQELFSKEDLEGDKLEIEASRVGEKAAPRPIRKQHKNWRLVGTKVEGEGLDDLRAGDLFVARIDAGPGGATIEWDVCGRGSRAYGPLSELFEEQSSAWFPPKTTGWRRAAALLPWLAPGKEDAAAPRHADFSPEQVDPAPGALIESLRGLGYSLPTAIADLVDNSIAAGANKVWLDFIWHGSKSLMVLHDDGHGMTLVQLREALRVGSRSPTDERAEDDLGRFGLGLKTASFSQCRRLTVASKRNASAIVARVWDLDEVVRRNSWTLLTDISPVAQEHFAALKDSDNGTVVIWEHLDRLVEHAGDSDEAAQRRFLKAVRLVCEHLEMVFHRWLDPIDDDDDPRKLEIEVNGHALTAWDPFLTSNGQTDPRSTKTISQGTAQILVKGFILPHHEAFADDVARDKAGGPAGWNGQQGFYVYRQRRLLVPGNWLGLGSPKMWIREQQTRLARIRLDLPNTLDDHWRIDLKKSDARPPASARLALEEYGEQVRRLARAKLIRRAAPAATGQRNTPIFRAWLSQQVGDRTSYRIARDHPLVQRAMAAAAADPDAIKVLLRLIEETVPVQQIWLTQADRPELASKPFDGDQLQIKSVLEDVYRGLRKGNLSSEEAKRTLRSMEPFASHPQLIDLLQD